jgi:hypothetical protein
MIMLAAANHTLQDRCKKDNQHSACGAPLDSSVTATLSAGETGSSLILVSGLHGLRAPARRVLCCPTDASLGSKCNESASNLCRERIGLGYLHWAYPTVMDSGEPPTVRASYGDHGIAG